jgi:hypothetical protein
MPNARDKQLADPLAAMRHQKKSTLIFPDMTARVLRAVLD